MHTLGTAVCSFVMLASAAAAHAATQSWRLDFEEELLAPTDPKLFVVPGEVAQTLLHVQQNDYCTQETPGEENPACPSSATLSFTEVPPGVSACFATLTDCVSQIAVAVGTSVHVRLTVNPLASLGVADLSVRALGSTSTSRNTSLPVHLVAPLFDPPSPVKLYRGAPSVAVVLPLTRPAGLTASTLLGLLYDTGSSPAGITSSFSPSTLSASATSTTLTLSASTTAPLGSRDVAVGATPLTQIHAMLAPFELVVANAFTVSVAPFSIVRGTTVTRPINVVRDPDFYDSISLSISGISCGPGVQAMVSHGQLVVQASASATTGRCSIGVRGTSGTITYETNASVTVY